MSHEKEEVCRLRLELESERAAKEAYKEALRLIISQDLGRRPGDPTPYAIARKTLEDSCKQS
jgi:hypothetical protein